jgi:lysophospholipase L1-like esterase
MTPPCGRLASMAADRRAVRAVRYLPGLLAATLLSSAACAAAAGFASTRPAARVEYWQQRQATIQAQVSDAAALRAVKLVFVGDSITDFWLLGDDPWIPGRWHGRRIWDESFAGSVPQNRALNIGISGDRTEHLLHRILPRSKGGLGQLDAPALAPEFFVLMVGINNSYAPESPVADSVFDGVVAVMRALHARKPRARLMLQSMLPTSEPARDDAVVRPVNARLAALAKSPEFAGFTFWLDLYPSFVDAQGRQDARLFVDGLHPSEAGYRVWRDRLVPALDEARARRR